MKRNILEYLEETAIRLSEKVAFYNDSEKLTFADLTKVSKAIGTALAAVAPQRTPVASLMDARSISNIPSFLGIIYAGCANAPFDITMPQERLKLLLDLLAPSAILADEKGRAALEGMDVNVPVINYEEACAAEADEAVLRRIRKEASVMDPLSILYTSGSTGIPKGSIQTHYSLIIWDKATIQMYGLTEDTVFANQSPFFYANCILDVFPPLFLGATVYLLPAGALTFPRLFVQRLIDHHINLLCMTPSSFISIVNAGVLTAGCVPELKWGIMSGESMPWVPLKQWMDATPNADWWHFYGSTEMFSVAVGKVQGEHKAGERLSVGKPFPMVHILFLDEDGKEVPAGTPGEMFVSSPWVSVGYHRDPARSAASWVIDPLDRGWHERFYRSGDLGYLTPEGELMVTGRQDNQIKHFGYRMELADVDKGLQAIGEVKESCVLYEKESGRIFCFYVSSLDDKALTKELKVQLQPYMLPDVFVRLDEMPHTASMKIDRVTLNKIIKDMPFKAE